MSAYTAQPNTDESANSIYFAVFYLLSPTHDTQDNVSLLSVAKFLSAHPLASQESPRQNSMWLYSLGPPTFSAGRG